MYLFSFFRCVSLEDDGLSFVLMTNAWFSGAVRPGHDRISNYLTFDG